MAIAALPARAGALMILSKQKQQHACTPAKRTCAAPWPPPCLAADGHSLAIAAAGASAAEVASVPVEDEGEVCS